MSAPRPRATRPLVPALPVERHRLRCGATLLVSPRPDAPVCAVQVHLRGGHSLDPEGREGTASLAGRLVDRGTRSHDEEQLAAALEPGAGNLSGGSTGVAGSIDNEDWRLLLDLLGEVLLEPSFPADKVARERRRLLDRLLVERDDPRTQAGLLFRRLVYGDHWLGSPEYGNLDSVAALERRDLVLFHRRHWVGKRAVIAFCGDVDPAAVRRFLDRRLAAWNPGRVLPPADATFPEPARRTAAFRAQRQQVHVYLGHLGIRRSDPDYPALVVMDHVLGTGPGFTNRISMRLRDELGLAYSVHASIHGSAGVFPGTFTAYIGTSPEHLVTAVQGFLREMRRIRDEPVTRDELELAKSYLTGSTALGYERAARRVQHLVSAFRNGLPDDHLTQLVESYARVTAADVREAARRHLWPDRPCLVVAGPVARKDLAPMLVGSR